MKNNPETKLSKLEDILDNPPKATQELKDLMASNTVDPASDSESQNIQTSAMYLLTKQLLAEPDYAYSFHANYACSIMDTLTQNSPMCRQRAALLGNIAASNIMTHFYGKEVYENYKSYIPEIENMIIPNGRLLYLEFITISVANGLDLAQTVAWEKLSDTQRHVWERTALAFNSK